MLLIYDFDGTLTPYSLAQYKVLKDCNYNDERLIERTIRIKETNNISFLKAYFQCIEKILSENNIPMTIENICRGAKNIIYNKAREDYFKTFQSNNSRFKHFIITSGFQDFIENTKISGYVDGIFGTTYTKNGNMLENIDFMLNDKKKVDVIKSIQQQNNDTNNVVYFGDGYTDRYAFEYVHKIGGKSVFIISDEGSIKTYNDLNKESIIDECFEGDFSIDSKLSKFVSEL